MLNPFLNPKNTIPILKSYISDPKRLTRLSKKRIKKHQDKSFRRIIKYAYRVPMYHQKYKEAGIHPNDIHGIEDIKKIPMISKDDLRKNYPDRLLPYDYNKKNTHVICTGGTTGKSVSIYTDFYTIAKGNIHFLRDLKNFNLNIRNAKFAHIGNFNECRIDQVAEKNFQKHLKTFMSLENNLNIDVNTPVKKMINKLDAFQPDYIVSYPAIFQHLAILKRKGFGKNLKPTVMFSAGAMLDEYTRSYVQDAFKSPLLNTYQSVEAHGIIASECRNGTWHVNDDFYYLEAIDRDGNLVDEGQRGHLVITRLWGRGTPIIRYTGMDDYVAILHDKECKCGLSSSVIKNGVEGRKKANIVLPDGKIFPPGAFCFIEPVLAKYKTYQIKQYQIIQKKTDEIVILIVVDEDLRDKKVSLNQIKKEIIELYSKKTGPKVNIELKEVDEIRNQNNASKPPPIVISYIKDEIK